MALAVTAAGEWIDDIQVGIVDHKWFGPIACALPDPSPNPPPSSALNKERKLWVSAKWFYLGQNGLLWLRGDLELRQVEKIAMTMKKDQEEGVEITVRTNEKEEVGKTEKSGWLCIPRMMRQRIIHEPHDTPAGGHFGVDRTY
jgi:hypothetical protein